MATATTTPAVALSDIGFIGSGLKRPECVLATRAGNLYSADWRGGVGRTTTPDGASTLLAGTELPGGRPLRPNGIALRRNGSFLLADLGETLGGVYELSRSGDTRPIIERVDGVDLPPTNFVHEDAQQRIWITVSTSHVPRAAAYRADVADGYIVLLTASGARIVADGLGYTNEALPSPDGRWLYVNETFGRMLSRFPLRADGSLGSKEVVTTFGAGTFPDGLTFDEEGGVWITSIVSNRVIRVDAAGQQSVILEDCDPAHLERCEAAFLAGTMGRPHLDTCGGRILRNISSLAFGGPDRRTAYLGCLLGDAIAFFRAPVAGVPPVHWDW
jgi:sugar lactone lactonase YvrE